MTEQERLEAVESLTKKLKGLEALPNLNVEAWPLFTGLPSSTVATVLEWAVVKAVSPVDLLMVVAAIAFQHGREQAEAEILSIVDDFDSHIAEQIAEKRKQATTAAKTASESIS